MTRGTVFLIVCIIAGLVVLCGLGFWQLDRMAWKEGLIARVEANLKGAPVSVVEALDAATKHTDGYDYIPVKLTGEYVPTDSVFEFTTFKGASGWNVYSLMAVSQPVADSIAPFAVINRGFIPYNKRDAFEDKLLPMGTTEVIGLLRSPPKEQPGAAFDNEIEKRTFYWRDIEAMASVFGKKTDNVASWYIDLGIPNQKAETSTFPISGTTLINFPNNHLQYALTWFGLGGTLFFVGGSFLWSRRRKNAE